MKKFLVVLAAVAFLMAGRPAAHAQDTGLSGKWHFVLDTEGGDREVDAVFTVDADGKVTGKFGVTDVAGTYADGKMNLSFTMTSEETGDTAPLKLVGTLSGAAGLSGTWEFASYSGTFTATRPKA